MQVQVALWKRVRLMGINKDDMNILFASGGHLQSHA